MTSEDPQKDCITFFIHGRPPRKYRGQSIWSSDDEAPLVKTLRQIALDARKEKGIECFECPVKLELTISAFNITNRNNPENYVGDLDAFVAGICESLSITDGQAEPNPIFQESDEIYPDKPILIKDDCQVVKIKAKKIKIPSDETSYTVSIEPTKDV